MNAFGSGSAVDCSPLIPRRFMSALPPRDPTASRSSASASSAGVSWSQTQSRLRSFARTQARFLRQLWLRPLFAILLLSGLGWWVGNAVERTLREELESALQAVLNADVAALQIWMHSQEAIAISTAHAPQISRLAAELSALGDRDGVTQLELLQAPQLAELRRELAPALEAHDWNGFIVVSPQLKVVASYRNDAVGLSLPDEQTSAMVRSVLAGKATVSHPMKSPIVLPDAQGQLRAGVPTMFALAPIRNADMQPVAVLGVRIRPEQAFSEIMRVARIGKTGETYAFDQQGIMLSQSRFDDQLRAIGLLTEDADSILNVHVRDPLVDLTQGTRTTERRSRQPLTVMAAAATSGNDGMNVNGYRDYRGVPVVGAWTWLKDYNLGVATEVDVAEAYRPMYILRLAFWSMFGLLVAVSIALSIYTAVAGRLNRQAQRAALEARQLGQYTLDEKLGEGGMGVVYRAHHSMLHRPTAVKFLNIEKSNEQTLARFEREVQLTSQLNHPNTICIYDYGRTPEGVFYYAMEYLNGIDLEQLVEQHGPLPEARVVHVLRQVCGSLAEAHGIGLIHRDIKPANMVLNARGGQFDVVKLLDFGLVKAMDSRRQANVTSAGSMTGTPLYLSPEAIQSPDDVDHRGDLYALGAVGYFLLTGKPVFDGRSVIDILQGHVSGTPEPPSARLGKPVSPQLEQLLLRCLAKNPNDRPQSAGDLADELDRCPTLDTWTMKLAQAWWEARGSAAGKSQSSSAAQPSDAVESAAETPAGGKSPTPQDAFAATMVAPLKKLED